MAEIFSDAHSTNHSPGANERAQASLQLGRVKEKIMQTWEQRVREVISSAPAKTISVPVLRNLLPKVLDNLISNISTKSSSAAVAEAGRIGKLHGDQRAGLTDYSFSQVLVEYRILRQVIFETLEQEKLQVQDVRDIILNSLDEGIEKAIEQFSIVRSEELTRSNRDLQHFASIAAHDLKSPLATIIGFTELLEDSLRGRIELQEVEFIQAIKRSSARMTLLIDRLLEYSSVGQEHKEFESIALHQIVKDVNENLKISIEKANASVYVDNELPTVKGDASLLTQVFQNLLTNALKFRHPQRKVEIHIKSRLEKDHWLISIRDNGIGFDPKESENIFSLFKRLEGVKLQTGSGSGIGLATVRKVIEIHGGKVWAESQPGVGSTFFFTLPKNYGYPIYH